MNEQKKAPGRIDYTLQIRAIVNRVAPQHHANYMVLNDGGSIYRVITWGTTPTELSNLTDEFHRRNFSVIRDKRSSNCLFVSRRTSKKAPKKAYTYEDVLRFLSIRSDILQCTQEENGSLSVVAKSRDNSRYTNVKSLLPRISKLLRGPYINCYFREGNNFILITPRRKRATKQEITYVTNPNYIAVMREAMGG